jgi:hypothetical protein
VYEGGLMRWPCKIKPGTVEHTPITGLDVPPKAQGYFGTRLSV